MAQNCLLTRADILPLDHPTLEFEDYKNYKNILPYKILDSFSVPI